MFGYVWFGVVGFGFWNGTVMASSQIENSSIKLYRQTDRQPYPARAMMDINK